MNRYPHSTHQFDFDWIIQPNTTLVSAETLLISYTWFMRQTLCCKLLPETVIQVQLWTKHKNNVKQNAYKKQLTLVNIFTLDTSLVHS